MLKQLRQRFKMNGFLFPWSDKKYKLILQLNKCERNDAVIVMTLMCYHSKGNKQHLECILSACSKKLIMIVIKTCVIHRKLYSPDILSLLLNQKCIVKFDGSELASIFCKKKDFEYLSVLYFHEKVWLDKSSLQNICNSYFERKNLYFHEDLMFENILTQNDLSMNFEFGSKAFISCHRKIRKIESNIEELKLATRVMIRPSTVIEEKG